MPIGEIRDATNLLGAHLILESIQVHSLLTAAKMITEFEDLNFFLHDFPPPLATKLCSGE